MFFVCLFGISYLYEGLEQLDPKNNALELSMAKAIYCVLMMHLLSVDATVIQQKQKLFVLHMKWMQLCNSGARQHITQ